MPRDPGHPDFRQGGTLGFAYTGWFRAKFHQRFRLFFRFDSKRKAIVYAWVNSDGGLRKEGDRNDPYAVFRRMLERGKPPASFDMTTCCASPGGWASYPTSSRRRVRWVAGTKTDT